MLLLSAGENDFKPKKDFNLHFSQKYEDGCKKVRIKRKFQGEVGKGDMKSTCAGWNLPGVFRSPDLPLPRESCSPSSEPRPVK